MTDQLNPQQEREYVEKVWEWIVVRKRDDRPEWEWFGSLIWQMTPTLADSEAAAYHAAFLYTKEHERKIADVENEIELLRWTGTRGYDTKEQCASHDRLVAVEQSRLAELMRGWKGEA